MRFWDAIFPRLVVKGLAPMVGAALAGGGLSLLGGLFGSSSARREGARNREHERRLTEMQTPAYLGRAHLG